MPVTKLALQRRHLLELHLVKQFAEKYTKVWSKQRPDLKIGEILPLVDLKLWNVFLLRCNYVDEHLMSTLEGQGYTIAEVKWLGWDFGEKQFEVRVMKTSTETNTKRLQGCINSPEETARIEKMLEAKQ